MDALAFLESEPGATPRPVYVLYGDEDFLKRQALAALRRRVLGRDGDDFSFSTHPGDKASYAAVFDELQTLPFGSPRRLVVVENADPFVTRYRTVLEKYVAKPSGTGVLVLEVKAWPGNTRLAKLLDSASTLVCKAPPAYKLADWCVAWAKSEYGKQLATSAARLLVDLAGPEMGPLDQELAKLAAYAAKAVRIEAADVDRLVGNSRAANVFKIFDAVGAGRAGEALAILNRLFDQGEEPIRILGAFSMQLRRLAQVAQLTGQGRSLAQAMDEAGLPPFARPGIDQQLRHLGRRTDDLYDWLLEVDVGLKGGSQLPPRTLLERLLIRLASGLSESAGSAIVRPPRSR